MRIVMSHEARQVPSWLIFDVRQRMKVFKAIGRERSEILYPESADALVALLNGTPRAKEWVPHRVTVITEDEDGVPLRRSQSPWLCMSYALTFRDTAIGRLRGYLSEIGEILPLDCDGGPLFIWQPLTVVDALDGATSEIGRFPDGRVMYIRRHRFVASKLAGIDAFKLPDDRGFISYLTERAVRIISGVVGPDIDFRLLWSDE